MKRIKTNIIELDKLFVKPCHIWLSRFVDGKIDAHEAFKRYGVAYYWLYTNSNYDLIGWEIENDCFDWENNSWAVAKMAQFVPQHFDPEKYNWKKHSWAIAQYASHFFDSEKYNWAHDSWAVAEYCPSHFDPEKYNWNDYTWAVEMFAPRLLNLKPQTV